MTSGKQSPKPRNSKAAANPAPTSARPAKVRSPVNVAVDPSAEIAVSHAIQVLCVDDHAVLIEGLKAQFAIEGKIEVVGRLATAARLLAEVERLRPDVVLLDIEMPGPDAFEMADRLKHAHPEVRVVILSAHIRDAFISASFAAGAAAYFAKSDELEDIVRGVHDVMQSRSGTFILGPKVLERCRPLIDPKGRGPALKSEGGSAAGGAHGGEPPTRLSSLTAREAEILRMIGKGLSRHQIASQLCRSAKTVDGHQKRLMTKLGIPSRSDLIRFAIREGLALV